MGREISYGSITEVCLEFLEDLALGVSKVSRCACLWEEFSQSETGHLQSPVHGLRNNPLILNFNKGDIFQIISSRSDAKV